LSRLAAYSAALKMEAAGPFETLAAIGHDTVKSSQNKKEFLLLKQLVYLSVL
jgi:hypothetical protein